MVKSSAYATPNPVLNVSSTIMSPAVTENLFRKGPLGYSSNEQNPVIKKVSRYMAGVYIVTSPMKWVSKCGQVNLRDFIQTKTAVH